VCGWLPAQWAVRLLPLLTGEGLSTTHGLPAATHSSYPELHRALFDRLGLTEEVHRRRFREIQWEDGTRLFAMAHQMRDAVGHLLLPDERSSRQLLEEVVREGFVLALPPSTVEWVMCHRPASLEEVMNLAEGHLALPPQTRGEGG